MRQQTDFEILLKFASPSQDWRQSDWLWLCKRLLPYKAHPTLFLLNYLNSRWGLRRKDY